MRKLNKAKILSAKYKSWEEKLEISGKPHPRYTSSSHRFYEDIFANLLNIQDGLCAYTEMRLCEKQIVSDDYWNDGRFAGGRFEFKGNLDHFDPSMKTKQAWLWENFYVVDSDVNTKVKRDSEVDHILDPGSDGYDENKYLDYNCSSHFFVAKSNLSNKDKDQVKKMIIILGLNFGPVKENRRRFLTDKLKMLEFGIASLGSIRIEEFPTAFKFFTTEHP